jgi:hypothetical protein
VASLPQNQPMAALLYYSKFERAGIWRMPLTGGEEIHVLDRPAGDAWWDWALTRNGIYFFDESNKGAKAGVKFFDFATREKISISAADSSSFGLAVSPDGRSILYSHYEAESDESNIMLVKNFH